MTVRKGAHDAGAPPDLAQDALERVVGANPPPMLLREGVVGVRRESRRIVLLPRLHLAFRRRLFVG